MTEASTVWYSLDLDPGTAAFFGLPPRFHVPAGDPEGEAFGERLDLPELARALERAVAANPEMATRAEVLRFLRRWRRYHDLDRYFRIGNMNFAHAAARALLREDPNDVPALAGLALVEARAARWEEAHELLTKVLAQAPDHAPSRLQAALCLASAGRREEALSELEALARGLRLPSHARLWRYEVRTRQAHDLATAWGDALAARYRPDDLTEEAADWTFAKERLATNPEVLYLRAVRPGEAMDDAERLGQLRQAVATDPDHLPAVLALAAVLRQTGDPPAALAALDEGLARHREDASLLAARGQALEHLGRRPEALDVFRRVLEGDLADLPPGALVASGQGLLRLAPAEEARSVLERAVSIRRRDPLPHQLLARLDEAASGKDAAERRLRTALQQLGPVASLQYALGDLLRRSDRMVEAEGLFKSLARHHPRSPWGHRGLGDMKVATRPAEALAAYAEAWQLDPGQPIPGYDYLRGVTALRGGKPEEAGRWLRRAVAGEPDNARYWCDLGAACFLGGDVEAAIAATRRALGLAPGHPGFAHNLSMYHLARFRRRPLTQAGSLWPAWRFRRQAARGKEAGWRRELWSPPGETRS